MAESPFARGRAGNASIDVQIVGLYQTLNKWAKLDPYFNQQIREASKVIAEKVIYESLSKAATSPNPIQSLEAGRALRVLKDRVPGIYFAGGQKFTSMTRPNTKRKKPVLRKDVFYGAEFGSNRFKQFPGRSPARGRGNRGYWFWQTVEKGAEDAYGEYMKALDDITRKLAE